MAASTVIVARAPGLGPGAVALLGGLSLVACGPTGPDCHTDGQLCVVAGTGQSGFNGEGAPAASSWLYWPTGLDFDPQGQLVIVDFNNVRLRRLDAGRLITVAGSGVHAWSEPGALVLESPLENPVDVAYTTGDTWYIAALHEARVLQVVDGRVSPYAGSGELGFGGDGGPAADAAMSEIAGIEAGPDGELYIADTGNHCLRRVGADGVISTLGGYGLPGYAGDGGPVADALFSSPGRLHLDGRQLYIADTGNHLIRRLDLDSGQIDPVAGTGAPGYDGDGGDAVAATLSSPTGVAVGPDGKVYIADTGNRVVRRVSLDGVIDTVAGTGEAPLTAGDHLHAVPATDAPLAFPMDVAVDEEALYIADGVASIVYRVALGPPR